MLSRGTQSSSPLLPRSAWARATRHDRPRDIGTTDRATRDDLGRRSATAFARRHVEEALQRLHEAALALLERLM
ncbi:hypothetical protein BE08_38375 [Sorangium cellulosum]|uniref:Uncharacterized protein n=1 Tax=Sorangium cellulosum TaxID=56 RepID=A0A150PKN9_SORCE|nr:hypothetical protein BE08_38375 [Sorangium cellulosum]